MPLIIVPTPVGNLGDMTLRGLEELRNADVIACEDTRHTLRLLNHFGIKKPLLSCHEHNERERADEIMRRVEEGQRVALVSDAGTPGLSDPGAVIVREAIARGLPFDVLPGANALLPALLIAGIGMESFVFVGFLKGKKDEKLARLAELRNLRETLVFYAAPHHLREDLALMAQGLGDRRVALVRELRNAGRSGRKRLARRGRGADSGGRVDEGRRRRDSVALRRAEKQRKKIHNRKLHQGGISDVRKTILHHDADILCQRRAPHRPRLHDDSGGRPEPLA